MNNNSSKGTYLLNKPLTFGDEEQVKRIKILYKIHKDISKPSFKLLFEKCKELKEEVKDFKYHLDFLKLDSIVKDINSYEGSLEEFEECKDTLRRFVRENDY